MLGVAVVMTRSACATKFAVPAVTVLLVVLFYEY